MKRMKYTILGMPKYSHKIVFLPQTETYRHVNVENINTLSGGNVEIHSVVIIADDKQCTCNMPHQRILEGPYLRTKN